jgi:hypothetical protein
MSVRIRINIGGRLRLSRLNTSFEAEGSRNLAEIVFTGAG